jgi:glycosyltransferase involved in cell wall biosynthesis
MSLELTIAMACYNEQGAVEACVREALGVLDRLRAERGRDGEVLVVDDGSTDASPEILARLVAEDARLRVVRHERNQGIGAFNPRMLAEARGEWVHFIAADGEFDPAEALRFLALAAAEGADAVLGYRAEKNYTPYRKVVSWSFNALTYLCFGARFRDVGSMRLLRRDLFQPIPLYSRSAFVNAERLLVGRRRGAVIVEVPIAHRKRLAGVGGGSRPRKVVEAFRDLLRTRARFARYGRFYE